MGVQFEAPSDDIYRQTVGLNYIIPFALNAQNDYLIDILPFLW